MYTKLKPLLKFIAIKLVIILIPNTEMQNIFKAKTT